MNTLAARWKSGPSGPRKPRGVGMGFSPGGRSWLWQRTFSAASLAAKGDGEAMRVSSELLEDH